MDDVVINKVETIERCLRRIREIEEVQSSAGERGYYKEDQNLEDAAVLNLQRACQAVIDLGARVVRLKQLGAPKESRDAFVLLEKAGLIDAAMASKLQKMVGFRNVAVHDYQNLDLHILEHVIREELGLFEGFAAQCLKLV